MKTKLNIILADDHPLFRKALRSILEAKGSYHVLEAGTGEEVMNLLSNHEIEIIFMDYSMPGLNGYDTAKIILSRDPEKKIIVLTQYDEIPVILNFFKIGVKGFLTKNADEKEILQSIQSLQEGNYYYHSRFDSAIGRWLSNGLSKNVPVIKFSERDTQLVILISKGKTSDEIGKQLGLSVRSIEAYRSKLLKDTQVKNTNELMNYVFRNGIM